MTYIKRKYSHREYWSTLKQNRCLERIFEQYCLRYKLFEGSLWFCECTRVTVTMYRKAYGGMFDDWNVLGVMIFSWKHNIFELLLIDWLIIKLQANWTCIELKIMVEKKRISWSDHGLGWWYNNYSIDSLSQGTSVNLWFSEISCPDVIDGHQLLRVCIFLLRTKTLCST